MKRPNHLIFQLALRYACLAIGIYAISWIMANNDSSYEDELQCAVIIFWSCVVGFSASLVLDFFRFKTLNEKSSMALLLAIIITWIFILIIGQLVPSGINIIVGLFIGLIFLIDALLILGIMAIDTLRLRAYIRNRA